MRRFMRPGWVLGLALGLTPQLFAQYPGYQGYPLPIYSGYPGYGQGMVSGPMGLPPGTQVIGVVTSGQLNAARAPVVNAPRMGATVPGKLVPMPLGKDPGSIPVETIGPPVVHAPHPGATVVIPPTESIPATSGLPLEVGETLAGGPAERSWRIIAQGGITLLHMDSPSQVAFRTVGTTRNAANLPTGSTTVFETRNFDNSLIVSPLAWLGIVSPDGLGVRGRYWYFSQSNSQSALNADTTGAFEIESALPGPFRIVSSATRGTGGRLLADGLAPDTFVASNHTEIHSGDLEAIGVYNSSCWTFLGGVGVRYVSLRQNYDVLRTNPGGSPTPGVEFTIDRETSNATHNLDAMGPTLGCEFSRRLGETGFALYGMGRGSLLVGQHRFGVTTERRLRGDIFGGIVDNTDRLLDSRTVHDIVPIGELEVGAQYTRDMGHCNLIVRAGFQCQTWIDAGTAIDSSGDLDFYGGTFLIGLQY